MLSSNAIPWFTLTGVILGFLLGEGSRYARHRWEIKRNKQIIRTELQAVLSQLPSKRDILRQAIAHLKTHRFMPTASVHAVMTGYQSVLTDVYAHLSAHERNCLHIIYERLRVADELMDGLEDNFLRTVKDEIVDDPWSVFAGRVEELLESYDVVEQLARSYLAGKPIDVFPTNASNED